MALVIKENYLVKKRNVLNELRANSMTLQELRFFSIYLSKINPADANTRTVRFPISDFQSIMELGRINIDYLKQVTNSLLCKVVNVPTERGGYTGFQLFKRCKVDMDDKNEWYVEIDAHDDALPLLFEFKEKYFTYQLWNALRLKSSNQLRMYEILKQYEKVGVRVLSVEDLRLLLGIDKKEYALFNNFKQRVLDGCQQALSEHTDIKFTYEPTGKKGRGGKVLYLKFTISKNDDYLDQLTLDRFIEEKKYEQPSELSRFDERLIFFAEACANQFSDVEMTEIVSILSHHLPQSMFHDDISTYDYLLRKCRAMERLGSKNKIHHKFNYFKTLLEKDDNPY